MPGSFFSEADAPLQLLGAHPLRHLLEPCLLLGLALSLLPGIAPSVVASSAQPNGACKTLPARRTSLAQQPSHPASLCGERSFDEQSPGASAVCEPAHFCKSLIASSFLRCSARRWNAELCFDDALPSLFSLRSVPERAAGLWSLFHGRPETVFLKGSGSAG